MEQALRDSEDAARAQSETASQHSEILAKVHVKFSDYLSENETCTYERWGRKKEASKVKHTTKQNNTTHSRQSK